MPAPYKNKKAEYAPLVKTFLTSGDPDDEVKIFNYAQANGLKVDLLYFFALGSMVAARGEEEPKPDTATKKSDKSETGDSK